MPQEFDIVLYEKELSTGLTRTNCMNLYDRLKETEAYPIEIENPSGGSSAMGFVTTKAADSMDYDYTELTKYIGMILRDMNLESENGCYNWNNLDIYLSRG